MLVPFKCVLEAVGMEHCHNGARANIYLHAVSCKPSRNGGKCFGRVGQECGGQLGQNDDYQVVKQARNGKGDVGCRGLSMKFGGVAVWDGGS